MFAPLYLISIMGLGVTALLVLLFIILVVSNIIIVPQASAYVIERLGAYQQTWGTGLHFKIPLIDRVANKVTMKERIADFKPQPVITRDNVTMQIDTVVYFFVSDPKLYTYGVVQPLSAIENLTATTLRNLIGELELDQTLTSRDIINSKMRHSGRGHRPLGHQGQSCGAEEHHPAQGDPGRHGAPDEGRA